MKTKLIKFSNYYKVHALSNQGVEKTQIAMITKLNIRTVYKYLSLNEEEFYGFITKYDNRDKILDKYEDEIKEILFLSPTISSKSVYNKIIHRYPSLNISEKTVFNYVKGLRDKFNIKKSYDTGDNRYLTLEDIYNCRIERQKLIEFAVDKTHINNFDTLYDYLKSSHLRYKKRAFTIICFLIGISKSEIKKFLHADKNTINSYIDKFQDFGLHKLFDFSKSTIKKTDNPKFKNEIFKILHEPPKLYGLNRTTWKLEDIKKVMRNKNLSISIPLIRKIIKEAGYSMKKARKVLTSNDPDYRKKLENITNILSNLKPDEKFFSVDEYGPFAIKMQGGRSYTKNGETKTYPQWQKSKGSLILTAALELSKNQVTFFYSQLKNTKEMIKLMEILIQKYSNERLLFLSWDAASWHISKELNKKVDENNQKVDMGAKQPRIQLCPLPACAQFLNVIESVFSGMSRAIIHNSDYQSVDECKQAINKYFEDRNNHFKTYPKKAGNKIWGEERVVAKFSDSNNCKDPRY